MSGYVYLTRRLCVSGICAFVRDSAFIVFHIILNMTKLSYGIATLIVN